MAHRYEAEEVPHEIAELEDALAVSEEPSDGEDLHSSCSPGTRVKRAIEEDKQDSSFSQNEEDQEDEDDGDENEEEDDDDDEESDVADKDEVKVMVVPATCVPKDAKRISRRPAPPPPIAAAASAVFVVANVQRTAAPPPVAAQANAAAATPRPKSNYKFLWQ